MIFGNRLKATALAVTTLGLLLSTAVLSARGQDGNPDDRPMVGARVVGKFRLGVNGDNTKKGFRIQSVIVGSRATRLPWGPGREIALETGDYITEVDGVPIDRDWTLHDAINDSDGVISLKVWDHRTKKYLEFDGVKLDRRR